MRTNVSHLNTDPSPRAATPMVSAEQGTEDTARATLLTLFGPIVIWATGVLLASKLATDSVPDGACEGIGFGCQLTPSDGALFAGVVLGLVAVPVATGGAAIAASVGRGAHGRRTARVGRLLVAFAMLALLFVFLAVASPSNS